MRKKEYMLPTMQVFALNVNAQILAGSVASVKATGLDDEEIVLPGSGLPTTGDVWDDAW